MAPQARRVTRGEGRVIESGAEGGYAGGMIRVTSAISIDEGEIREEFVLASGPGGQNVNKVATAVQLRFDAAGCASIDDDVRERLRRLAGRRMTKDGVLILDARRFRTRERNRRDAMDRLIDLIRRAAHKPKPRRKTQPTAASRRRRLADKRRRSEAKRRRRAVAPDEE